MTASPFPVTNSVSPPPKASFLRYNRYPPSTFSTAARTAAVLFPTSTLRRHSFAVHPLFRLCLFLFCSLLFFAGFGKIVKAQHFDSQYSVEMFLAKPSKKLTSLSSQFFPNTFALPQQKTFSYPFEISAAPYGASRVAVLQYNDVGTENYGVTDISLRGNVPCAPRDERRLFDKHNSWNRFSTFRRIAGSSRKRIFSDMKNFYDRDNLLNFGVVLAGSAVFANTKLDRNFQRWYQENVRTSSTNDFASASKIFGEGQYFIPAAISSALIYRWCQERSDNRSSNALGDFVSRTARGYALGAPTLFMGQYVLGADRPSSGSSYWKPFQDTNGISGHAFIGATPFITAAQMTENPWAKGAFYTLSTFPAWSRVNDNAHYLSQAVLGWYLSYLSVRAVSETEGLKPLPKGLTLFPVVENKSFGIGFLYRY